eukprot:CAMPEP_0176458216 /NCGR_PEP_ID=MMETSP0127-20121128/32451_1 /TAXON_ID=938130 /ORGANISM="Platyophrya macrostoma, Strain WH" /LENGTH=493 /DNA_ID=CAMNT_0017848723 /DNA_START=18 /DNA_END=1499 /DNA_ORIENTATION=-
MNTIKKKVVMEKGTATTSNEKDEEYKAEQKNVVIRFKNFEGKELENTIEVSLDTAIEELHAFINKLLDNDEALPYSFYYDTYEIKKNLKELKKQFKDFNTELTVPITYHPQNLFVVKPITRQTSSLSGHSDSILSAAFSPDSKQLASGSGDCTVRFWDILTETPRKTGEGHKKWVLVVSWAPNAKRLASGSMDNEVRIWDPETGDCKGALRGHSKWITALAWEPLHKNKTCNRLASASKDATVKVWNVDTHSLLYSMSGHGSCVTKVIWGGQGLVYTSSEDRTIKVWDDEGCLLRSLGGHGHWVNTIALSTEYALRTGCFDEKDETFTSDEKMQERALERYNQLKGSGDERLVSGSDDFTLFMWDPVKSSDPVTRMTGHQQPVNHIAYSPDGRYIVSGSFDKSLRIWDGISAKFVCTLRGHVGPVYQVAWSIDSRYFVSASKDTTLKVWDIRTRKLMFDLPGHADEIYTVDWSPNGEKVVSGGKDRLLKIWRN